MHRCVNFASNKYASFRLNVPLSFLLGVPLFCDCRRLWLYSQREARTHVSAILQSWNELLRLSSGCRFVHLAGTVHVGTWMSDDDDML